MLPRGRRLAWAQGLHPQRAVYADYTAKAANPMGLSLCIGFESGGYTEHEERFVPHKTVPEILYIYGSKPVPIRQIACPGPVETVAIHYNLEEFTAFVDDHCLDGVERDCLLQGLSECRDYRYWHPQPSLIEALRGLIHTELTGIRLKLYFNQVVISVLHSFFNHLLDGGKAQSLSADNGLSASSLRTLHKAVSYIENNLAEKLTLRSIALHVSCSEKHLKQLFPRLYGETVAHYVLKTRMSVAHSMVVSGRATIQQTAAYVGYASQASFSAAFRKYHQMTPKSAQLSGV